MSKALPRRDTKGVLMTGIVKKGLTKKQETFLDSLISKVFSLGLLIIITISSFTSSNIFMKVFSWSDLNIRRIIKS